MNENAEKSESARPGLIRRALHWVIAHAFSSPAQSIVSGLAFLGALGGIFTAWDVLARLQKKAADLIPLEAAYLWTSFLLLTVLAAAFIQLLSIVVVDLKSSQDTASRLRATLEAAKKDFEQKLSKEKELAAAALREEQKRCDRGALLLHEVVQALRTTILSNSPPDWPKILQDVRDFARETTSCGDVCVTVKYLDEGHLVTQGRAGPSQNRTAIGERLPADESVVYGLFRSTEEGKRHFRQVLVRDALELGVRDAKFVERAKGCDFRSVLAFPLRGPRTEGELFQKNQLFGFLSLDSPHPNIFDHWFDESHPEHDWTKQNLFPVRPLDIYYGTADAAATMVRALAKDPKKKQGVRRTRDS